MEQLKGVTGLTDDEMIAELLKYHEEYLEPVIDTYRRKQWKSDADDLTCPELQATVEALQTYL